MRLRLRLRQGWLTCLVCLGCQSMTGGEPHEPHPPAAQAQELWQQGQEAMEAGQPDEAIELYRQSLDADRRLERNHLSLAAAFLEKDDELAACRHLAEYVADDSDCLLARAYLAELLLRLGQLDPARAEFIDDAEANRYRSRGMREPWII